MTPRGLVTFTEDGHTYTYDFGDYAIKWIEAYCVHTIGDLAGRPLILDQWQKDFIREMFLMEHVEFTDHLTGDTGMRWRFVYQSIVLGVPRGAGKSTLAAAICLFKLSPACREQAPRVLNAAASRENALHVYGPARDMVQMSDLLGDSLQANKNQVWCDENRGMMWRTSAEGKTNFGHLPSFIVRDELHAWETDRQVTLSEALVTALAKRHDAQCLSPTTAGYDKDTILGRLYDSAKKHEGVQYPGISRPGARPHPGLTILRDRVNRFLFWWYEAPKDADIEDPATWKIAHPASWIDEDAVRAQLNDPSISVDEFRRQWLNQWTAAKEAWLPIGLWRGLRSAAYTPWTKWRALSDDPLIPKGARVQVAVDAAISKDTAAVAWAYGATKQDPIVVRCRVWAANEDTAYHEFVQGGRIDLRFLRDFIADDLRDRYKITEVVYDPRFFEGAAFDLSDYGLRVAPFEQNSALMADALNSFYVGCMADTPSIVHDGDEVLTAHVEATAGTQRERGWYVYKLKQSKKIDACIAVVMAQARARLDVKKRNASYIQ
jgi:phage terminase large subunit-like protein